MSVAISNLQIDESLNRLWAFRKSDDFNWQLAAYSKFDEIILVDADALAVGNVNRHFQISALSKGTLVAAMSILLAQQQLNGAAAIPTENFQNYSKWILEAGSLNSLQQSGQIQLPQVDINPIDVAEESKTISADKAELETIFNGLLKKWKEETRGYSLTSQKYAHPAYQSILVLGSEVVPFILRDLQSNGGRWFEALKALTKRDDITKPSDSYEDAVKAWIAWGKRNKLIS
jgi:hypothetical protein